MAGERETRQGQRSTLPLIFILENTMMIQEDYIKLDYTTGTLVKPSVGARVEGDPASLGIGLIVGEIIPDGHGGFRVPVKWMGTKRQMIWKMYVEDLTIISPAGGEEQRRAKHEEE